jgi:hypothetical protein
VLLIYEPDRKVEMGSFWARSWGTIFRGRPYRVLASENRFTEAGLIECPPPKIDYLWRRLY